MKANSHKGLFAASLSILLGSSLLSACYTSPATTQTTPQNQLDSNDPFISQARVALANYQEADATFSDSQTLASQDFSIQQIDYNADASTGTPVDPSAGASTGTGASTNVNASTDINATAGTGSAAGTNVNASTTVATGASASPTPGASPAASSEPDRNDFDAALGTINAGLGGGADITGNSAQVGTQLDSIVGTQLGSTNNFAASVNLFNQAAGNFSTQLLGTQGVEINNAGQVSINYNRLRADLTANLQGDTELSNPSIDLNGQLNTQSNASLTLHRLLPLGFEPHSSQVISFSNADGSTSKSVLFTYQGLGTILTNRVRVMSTVHNLSTDALKLRLESQAQGFSRVGLREVSRDANGQLAISTNTSTKFRNGTTVDMLEKRFVNATGGGTGIGTFSITDGAGQSYSGSLRTIAGANGRLMMLIEPTDAGRGRLLMQDKGDGHATLMLYNSQGQQTATSDFNLYNSLIATANS